MQLCLAWLQPGRIGCPIKAENGPGIWHKKTASEIMATGMPKANFRLSMRVRIILDQQVRV